MSEPLIKVYSRLTLTEAEALAGLGDLAGAAVVAPPVQAGDLTRDVRDGIGVVVVIDGRFFQSHALPPSEIVDGLRAGLRVYGASSMGALRAAETEAHGMIGCGAIFELIKATPYFRDDLLGQAFDPDSGTAFSVPWVDTYFNLRELCRRGELADADAELIAALGAGIHFTEREAASYAAALRRRHPERLDLLPAVERAFSPELGSQKRRDALATLARVGVDLARVKAQNASLTSQTLPERFSLGLFHGSV